MMMSSRNYWFVWVFLAVGSSGACLEEKDLLVGRVSPKGGADIDEGGPMGPADGADAGEGGPVAVAALREFDPDNPGAPYSEATSIRPLTRIYFDGRGSYSPRDPTNPALITTYAWEIVSYPAGADPELFGMQGQASSLLNFWAPLVGAYDVRLTVWDETGIQSADGQSSHIVIGSLPSTALFVQLTWDDVTSDQDLHLMKLPEATDLCVEPWDCYFGNRQPAWFSEQPLAEVGNPSLDIDDTDGLGPEAISIAEPEPGTYRIATHAWRADGPTRNTVRVYVHGELAGEYQRTVGPEQAWRIADVIWGADGTATVSEYPADTSGQVGATSLFTTSACSGF
jgi:hypothetical protein